MATNTSNPTAKKRRWYHAYGDAYTVTARSFPWVGWTMGGLVVVIMATAIALGIINGGLIWTIISGILFSILSSLLLLTVLVRPATYRQLDGTTGAVYSVVSQLRGWSTDEMPAQMTRDSDLVWRMIGRPGVVLISEGPRSQVTPLLHTERKMVARVVTNVPIILIQVGHEEGQIPLPKLPRKLRGLKPILTKQEVPAVANRLAAVGSKTLNLPRGIDPKNPRMNRRALRG